MRGKYKRERQRKKQYEGRKKMINRKGNKKASLTRDEVNIREQRTQK